MQTMISSGSTGEQAARIHLELEQVDETILYSTDLCATSISNARELIFHEAEFMKASPNDDLMTSTIQWTNPSQTSPGLVTCSTPNSKTSPLMRTPLFTSVHCNSSDSLIMPMSLVAESLERPEIEDVSDCLSNSYQQQAQIDNLKSPLDHNSFHHNVMEYATSTNTPNDVTHSEQEILSNNLFPAPRKILRPALPWSEEQNRYLERIYQIKPYLDVQVRDTLASKMSLPPARIKKWFQNRRTRDRKSKRDTTWLHNNIDKKQRTSPHPDTELLQMIESMPPPRPLPESADNGGDKKMMLNSVPLCSNASPGIVDSNHMTRESHSSLQSLETIAVSAGIGAPANSLQTMNFSMPIDGSSQNLMEQGMSQSSATIPCFVNFIAPSRVANNHMDGQFPHYKNRFLSKNVTSQHQKHRQTISSRSLCDGAPMNYADLPTHHPPPSNHAVPLPMSDGGGPRLPPIHELWSFVRRKWSVEPSPAALTEVLNHRESQSNNGSSVYSTMQWGFLPSSMSTMLATDGGRIFNMNNLMGSTRYLPGAIHVPSSPYPNTAINHTVGFMQPSLSISGITQNRCFPVEQASSSSDLLLSHPRSPQPKFIPTSNNGSDDGFSYYSSNAISFPETISNGSLSRVVHPSMHPSFYSSLMPSAFGGGDSLSTPATSSSISNSLCHLSATPFIPIQNEESMLLLPP